MNTALSIFFNIDRAYLTVVSQGLKGLNLDFIEATRNRIDLENIYDPQSQKGIAEIHTIINEIKDNIDNITITVPAESVFVTQFPGQINMTREQLNKLVALEIKQAFPQFNPQEFASNLIPLHPDKNGKSMMLASIMQREIMESVKEIFNDYLPVTNIEISQINAHTAFLYNYPEYVDKTIMILGVQDQFIDLSLIKNTKPAYYNLLSFGNKEKFGDLIESAFNELVKDVTDTIDGIYYFGTGLTKDLYFQGWEMASALGVDTNRLNAFRMITTGLDKRRRDYCSVMQHVFPPCIGAAIPAFHNRIRLF